MTCTDVCDSYDDLCLIIEPPAAVSEGQSGREGQMINPPSECWLASMMIR